MKSSEDSALRCNTNIPQPTNLTVFKKGKKGVILKIPREKLSGSLLLFTIHRNRRDIRAIYKRINKARLT